jgi:hypothetical protein
LSQRAKFVRASLVTFDSGAVADRQRSVPEAARSTECGVLVDTKGGPFRCRTINHAARLISTTAAATPEAIAATGEGEVLGTTLPGATHGLNSALGPTGH